MNCNMGNYRFFPIFFLLLLVENLVAQPGPVINPDTAQIPYIDISKITLSQEIAAKIELTYIDPTKTVAEEYSQLAFRRMTRKDRFVPENNVTKKAILRFKIVNTSDTTHSCWFFPGLYFWDAQLYQLVGGRLQKIPSILPEKPKEISYRLITLPAHDSATLIIELTLVRTHLNAIRPSLISPEFLSSYVKDLDATNMESKIVTHLFCGLLLMMILFSLATYSQGGNQEFLYYSGYAFFLGLMLFIKAIHSYHTSWFSFFQETYLDLIMQNTGILMYMLFMQKFLATRKHHPFLHKFYNVGILLLVVSTLLYTYVHYFTYNFPLENKIENTTKLLLLAMIVIFLVYSTRHWQDKLLVYLFWGNLFLLLFSLFSLLMLTGNIVPRNLPAILGSSLFYYEIGLLLELIFFLLGLNHKNKRRLIAQTREREQLKAKNQLNEYEKEIAIYKAQQQERERISADMHDELGSGMTAIRLMSEIARNKMKENTPIEIEKISHSADEVLNKMNAIIWSMNSGNDTIDNLVSYIRSYAIEYFENTPIICKITTPDQIEPTELTGDKRRNLFLCVKETLNNVLKHSKASELKIDFTIDRDLIIQITDNGVGIDRQKIRQFGNGLKNIAKRMESIGGSYQIENTVGTTTILKLPL
ncbi:sensor histidine kinase [Terrimonas alba]|uniref:sensor histidine kinase n=1 Tax=Terrimonas alba TaxID=3349636 RepID=UPI0035F4A5B1